METIALTIVYGSVIIMAFLVIGLGIYAGFMYNSVDDIDEDNDND